MKKATVLHYMTQWMWLSDSFVFGPISRSSHRVAAISRMETINGHVYPPPSQFHSLAMEGALPSEGAETAQAITKLIGSLRPDVVHVHHGYGLPDATALARALGVPLVATFWGYDVTALPGRDPIRLGSHFAEVDVVIVPSQFLATRVISLGVEQSRIRVVPGSVDTRFFTPTPLPRKPTVTFVGRFVPKKGVDTLLRAWSIVRGTLPEAELTLLGYGEVAPHSDAELGVQVLTPDPVDPRGQVRDIIRQARVYVSPSQTGPDGDSESQHIGNLEAQSSGRVVLTTDHGAIPEFIQNEITGVVVPEANPTALAASMIDLLCDYDRCVRLARDARLAAERLETSLISQVHDSLYSQFVD